MKKYVVCTLCNSSDTEIVGETDTKSIVLCHTCDRIHHVSKK